MKFYRFEIRKSDGDAWYEYDESLNDIKAKREQMIQESNPDLVIGSIQVAKYVWVDLEDEKHGRRQWSRW